MWGSYTAFSSCYRLGKMLTTPVRHCVAHCRPSRSQGARGSETLCCSLQTKQAADRRELEAIRHCVAHCRPSRSQGATGSETLCCTLQTKQTADRRELEAVRDPWSWRGQLYRLARNCWEWGATPGGFVRALGPWGRTLIERYARNRYMFLKLQFAGSLLQASCIEGFSAS